MSTMSADVLPRPANDGAAAPARLAIDEAIARACGRIAPLWPLKHFVAVNPFVGFADQSFARTCQTFARVAHTDMVMPASFYAPFIEDGSITDQDIGDVIAESGLSDVFDVVVIKLSATASRADERPRLPRVATIAEILDRLAGGDTHVSRTAFMIDEISKWCAAYFDEGQAAWASPWRDLRPYAAWRAAMRLDRGPETMGVRAFRQTVARLPEKPEDAIAFIVAELAIPERALEDYLFRALFDIQGWAAYARYRVWDNALYGRSDDTLVNLLAIRVAWGYALFKEQNDPAFRKAWTEAMQAASEATDEVSTIETTLQARLVLQDAYERAFQRRLLSKLTAQAQSAPRPRARPAVQAAFCIDVRSEVFRRALESASPEIETIGFAGFFGFPIEYIPIGNRRGGAQCPVLLKPAVIVCEEVKGASAEEEVETLGLRLMRRRAAKAWKAFKQSAVSSFAYVETMGLGFAAKLVSDGLGATRPVPDPNRDGLDADVAARLAPRLDPQIVDGRATGFASAARIDMAEAVLRAMSMTETFARIVMLSGHGSTSVNNPHASGLDCGACGGHTGEANARVAAAILNDANVRAGLRGRGILIPEDTWFIGCLHNTTTDEIELFNTELVPSSHRAELVRLRDWLSHAAARARGERAPLLGVSKDGDLNAAIVRRSRDWSQVRPEWGLAGNAAFIAAPRERTKALDLHGRAFLHDYDWRKDSEFRVLELIMTAPMVVASWINLQYYGSAVNNAAFGSGNKTLHNVVGALGVLEGNGGDLRPGLPWQSVHDGRRLMHEPLRLNVFIAAPMEAINNVIIAHESVRQLVENKWIHLYAIDEDGSINRYWGDLCWGDAVIALRS
ncbi:MAG: DUF2309 domain-containing protein [Hyphomonadaceae bacterium]|nr:DUF2309 domain-containing protein [Hyphomonadaceae bacterium]